MFRKMISLITLAALLVNTVGLAGCASWTKVSVSEINLEPPNKVSRLKLHGGETLVWNADGAEYTARSRQFKGVTDDGTQKRVRLEAIDSVYYVIGEGISELVMERREFHEAFIEKRWHSINGRIRSLDCESGTVKFKKHTAVIDTSNQAVIGITKQGDTLSVPFSEIHTLTVAQGSNSGTFVAFVAIAAGVAMLALAAYFSQAGPELGF